MPIRELTPAQKKRYRKPAGIVLLLIGIALVWFTLCRPLAEARHTGILHFSFKALTVTPAILYLGAFFAISTLEDDDLRRTSATGKRTWTSAGWAFLVGLLAFIAVSGTAWVVYLHTQGFNVF